MAILTEIPEGSSSTQDHRYGVFLSFRGIDTRHGFTDHLYKALMDANVKTFLDDEEIETGEDLKPELESAIRASKASIIVLSKNYATSTWCLDELVLILEQRLTNNQIVIPVFYHVEPTDVRKQQSSFGDAMDQHRQRMEAETNVDKKSRWAQNIDKWKSALTEVSDLKGKYAKGRRETEFIEEIVTNINRRIGESLFCNLPYLLGVKDSIEFISSWLKDGSSHKADILTILGMGGIGKTSLARYVYGSHSHLFNRSSFVEGIGAKCSSQFNGLLNLQKQLCGDISKTNSIKVHDTWGYTPMIENALTRKKALLVLDDIDSLNQLHALLGKQGFHPGSKIILTTKEASLPEKYASSIKNIVQPELKNHLLKGLDWEASLQLLSHHAFMSNVPKEGYEEVSKELMVYCQGHPLALKILGENLYNRDVTEWEERIDALKEETNPDIIKVLQMSFDSMPSKLDKELFKYIACFFVRKQRKFAETVLQACGMKTISGIRNLTDRCLLSSDNTLMMHQLLQDMGRDLVRQESPDKPQERSRLWCHEESFNVLEQNKGTENIKGLILDMRMLEKENLWGSNEIKTEALSKMDNLMILQLNYVQLDGSYKNFPKKLRWLCMHGFPLKDIPLDLPMHNVVVLDMSYSKIVSFGMCFTNPQKLESGKKHLSGSCSKHKRILGSLKLLELSFCEQLTRLGGFFELPALEELIVRNCISLIEICESLDQCVEVVCIDLSNCIKLEKLPTAIGKLKKLETLLVDGCNTCEPQIKVRDMDSQASSSAVMQAVGRDLKFFAISLPKSLVRLSLANNNLSTESFPMNFSSLSMLKYLCLDGNPIVSMPNCVRSLTRLEDLSMDYCDMLTSIEHPPSTLRYLTVDYNDLLRRLVFNREMSPLKFVADPSQLATSSIVIEGMVKIQPMADVEEKVLHSLGWTDLDFIKRRHIQTYYLNEEPKESQTQMYYEFGIFSTFYGVEEMPNWIRDRSQGKSISFTIPSSSKKLRGLNFCHVQTPLYLDMEEDEIATDTSGASFCGKFNLPDIIISNITQNHDWVYIHFISQKVSVGEECLTFLSHWMFGTNEIVGGDQITITVEAYNFPQCTKECGISLLYNDESIEKDKEEEEALGYYKSWNHIIGGDLSGFQSTTGEYVLDTENFRRNEGDETMYQISGEYVLDTENFRHNEGDETIYHSPYRSNYKEKEVSFRAFSKRKSDVHIRAHEDVKRIRFTPL